ncbi:Sedlin [Conidiobolus coronatus NRRL 28638]|uniref:Trafficking protein particle complex subunit 2-like protein n=1 Tax=Conidiobolus coronatus (strain ATCC 28846 / CBS 209.66 / NRRL 28638) TaxID=796925 RepID=A0A137PHL7_CONC2|nr:Sedlin [Conidiobolus coronatus NRRL 28638]|eukprot:KXN74488.1 Sedlin [Conidiobolus coronatus NRRL 28638]
MSKLLSIGIIGKQNEPLFIHSFNTDINELKFHYLIHTSIDLIEEKITNSTNNRIKENEQYLGLLHIVEDFVIYGYVTNTKIKLILIASLNDQIIRDIEVKKIFKNILASYIMIISNPFYDPILPNQKINSKYFSALLDRIGKGLLN